MLLAPGGNVGFDAFVRFGGRIQMLQVVPRTVTAVG
jgi:hypothetical protein